MLWSLNLPVYITTKVIAVLILAAFVFAPIWGGKRKSTLLWSSVYGVALFIPACTVVQHFVDMTRFGGFAFVNADAVKDPRISRWLPPTATDITLYRDHMGHHARFQIEKEQLISWLNKTLRAYGEELLYDVNGVLKDFRPIKAESIGRVGWKYPTDCVDLGGLRAENGRGFTLYYSEIYQTAYLHAFYW